jgi:LPXTG-motif cell wall-anchored protein
VVGATTTTTSGAGSGAGLPTTGGSALPGMLIAFGAALLGTGAVVTSRRRTRA